MFLGFRDSDVGSEVTLLEVPRVDETICFTQGMPFKHFIDDYVFREVPEPSCMQHDALLKSGQTWDRES